MIGNLYYQDLRGPLKIEKQQELAAIISLKIDQIIYWRQERIDFAGTLIMILLLPCGSEILSRGGPTRRLRPNLLPA